jgi:hypothetical protein
MTRVLNQVILGRITVDMRLSCQVDLACIVVMQIPVS